MLNPLMNLEVKNNEILFTNYFNKNNVLKKIVLNNKQNKDEILYKLNNSKRNIDLISVNKEKWTILNKIKNILLTNDSLYTNSSLLELILISLNNIRFNFIGPVTLNLKSLKALNSKESNITHHLIAYTNFEELKDHLYKLNVNNKDTIFFIRIRGSKIVSVGPMIKNLYRTDLNSILAEMKRNKDSIIIKNNIDFNDVLDEYLKSLIDLFTNFFSNYSYCWEREMSFENNNITLSERIIN